MKKRLLSILLALSMVLGVCPTLFLTAHADAVEATEITGTGTEDDPFIIDEPGDFYTLYNSSKTDQQYDGGFFKLTKDLDLTGIDPPNDTGWLWTTSNGFYGSFDGGGHTLKGLKKSFIFATSYKANGQTIRINDLCVEYYFESNTNIFGGIVATATAPDDTCVLELSNCTVKGTMIGYIAVGGLIGCTGQSQTDKLTININKCRVYGDIVYKGKRSAYAGGFIGQQWSQGHRININESFVSGNVTNGGAFAGTAVNYFMSCFTVKNCYFAGTESVHAWMAGGYMYSSFENLYLYDEANTDDTMQNLTNIISYRSSASSLYVLTHTHETKNETTGLTEEEFADQENFEGFDFDGDENNESIWVMSKSLGRPVLRNNKESLYPEPQIPDNIPVTVEVGESETLDLAQYIKDGDDTDLTDQFTYALDEDSEAYAELDADKLQLTLKGDEVGEHTVKVTGTYKYKDAPENEAALLDPEGDNDIEFNITLTVNKTVPTPEAEYTEFSYSPYTKLNMIPLTDDWQWADGTKIPPTGSSQKFKVIYPVPEGSEDYYLYTPSASGGYDEENGYYYDYITLNVTESDYTPYTVNFTVKNGDDNRKTIEGARFSTDEAEDFEFPNGNESKGGGKLTASMAAGLHKIYVYKEGYYAYTDTIQIVKGGGQSFVIELVPKRVEVKLPAIYDENGDLVDTKATVIKLDADENPANAWNGGNTTAGYKGGDTEKLPTGKYEVDLSAYGYSDETIYMVVGDDGVKYYENYDPSTGNVSGELTGDDLKNKLRPEKLGAAEYDVKLTKSDENKTVTAKVYLKNIKATSGSFGIRYDADLLSFAPDSSDDFKLNGDEEIVLADTPETEYRKIAGEEAVSEWKTDKGYYAFRWRVGEKEIDNKEINTEKEEKLIATLVFRAKTGVDLETDLTYDSLGLIAWTDTQAAKEYKTWYDKKYDDDHPAAGDYRFYEHWRTVDSENNQYALGIGRVESAKAVVNGIDMKGFYQVTVNDSLGSEGLVSLYDVMTTIDYEFELTKTALRFTVLDSISGEPVEGARVVLYPADDTPSRTEKTNAVGVVRYIIDTAAGNDVYYTYSVERDGYQSVPLSGKPSDRDIVVVSPGIAKNVEVLLIKKVYHVPDLKGIDKGEGGGLQLVGNMDLGGERLAYNGIDFHFRAKAAPGYKIEKYPQYATVKIADGDKVFYEEKLKADDEYLFTIKGKNLDQAELSKADLQRLYEVDDDFKQPNEDGYRSYNIEITFDDFVADKKELQVNASAGEHGKVSYDPANADSNLQLVTVKEDHEYTVTNIIPGTANQERVGVFKFEAVDDGYVVEKVFINGVQVHDYDNLTDFTYDFGKPVIDGSIAVTFWDGINPSKDSIITLVVGGFGAVDVTAPKINDTDTLREADVRETRRVYINPDPSVSFITKPDPGYQLYSIETQLDGGARVPYDLSGVTNLTSTTDNSFTFNPIEGESETIFVTFKHPKADITPTIFVKSYIERGNGTIDPFGLLVYNIYDTVTLNLNAVDGWDAKAVKVSPFGEPDKGGEIAFPELKPGNTYIIDSIREDTEVGAIFEEHTYLVTGTVDLSQGYSLDNGPWANSISDILSGATVTFVRTADTEGNKLDDQMTVKTVTGASRKDAAFSIEIPIGTWTVTVSKQGYVKYIITKYLFNPNEEQKELKSIEFSGKSITPIIGSTTDSTGVSVIDISGIRSGLRANISDAAKAKADVDNNGIVDVTDMTFVLDNFGARTTYKAFDKFDNGN